MIQRNFICISLLYFVSFARKAAYNISCIKKNQLVGASMFCAYANTALHEIGDDICNHTPAQNTLKTISASVRAVMVYEIIPSVWWRRSLRVVMSLWRCIKSIDVCSTESSQERQQYIDSGYSVSAAAFKTRRQLPFTLCFNQYLCSFLNYVKDKFSSLI